MEYAAAGVMLDDFVTIPTTASQKIGTSNSIDALVAAPRERGPWETPDQRLLNPAQTTADVNKPTKTQPIIVRRSTRPSEHSVFSAALDDPLMDNADAIFAGLNGTRLSSCT